MRIQVVPRAPVAPVITTSSPLPIGIVGAFYSKPFAAQFGTPPYTWAITAGGVSGLTMSPGGILSGIPTVASAGSLTVVVTDSMNIPSAPTNFSLTVQTGYGFDHYASPTGSDTNTGLDVAHPWSISAIYTKAPGSWTVLGLMPGVYTGSTDVPSFYNAYQANTWNAMTIPAGNTIASCDALGHYDGNRYAIIDMSDTGNGGNQPLGLDASVLLLGGPGVTVDAVEIRYCGAGGIVGQGTSNCRILNCEIHHLQATYEQKNSNAISWNGNIAGGALNNYVYNCYIHDNFTLSPTPGKLDPASLTTTGGNIAVGGAPFAGRVGNGTNWPFSSTTIQAGVWFTFTDTGQTIGVITSHGIAATFGSNVLTWQAQAIAATNGIGTWTVTPFYPYAMWGYYGEAQGKAVGQPLVIESCTAQRQFWNGNKTNIGQVQLKRSYFEIVNFGTLPAGSSATSLWAYAGLDTKAGLSSGADHCIFVGMSHVFNEGVAAHNQSDGTVNAGTATMTHNTWYMPPSVVGQSAHLQYGVDGITPGTLIAQSNLFASAAADPVVIWISDNGTNPGTITLNHNAHYSASYKQTNQGTTPLNIPGTVPTLTLAQIQAPPYGYEQNSIDLTILGHANPFAVTPVPGDVSTFAVSNTNPAFTAGVGGTPAGAIDGTVGQNGMPVGCNFSKLAITTTSLPNAKVGTPYSARIVAQGGSREYIWTMVSADPNWLQWLGANGRTLPSSVYSTADLSGLPQMVTLANQPTIVVIQVADVQTGITAQATFTFPVLHQ